MKFVILVLGLGALAGCQTAPTRPEEPKFPNVPQPCRTILEALFSPFADTETKGIAMEMARANNCLSGGQPTTVRIVQ